MAGGGSDVGGPNGKKRKNGTDSTEGNDDERRYDGIARMFYPGRHTRRAASPVAPPGEDVYRLVAQIVDPDDIVFFDWSPSDGHAPTGPAGEIVLMTTRTLTHVTYQPARPADAHNVAGNADRDGAATDIAVHRLKRVRSLHWSAGNSSRTAANGHRRGIVIVGDDWQVTVSAAGSADHIPYLTHLLKLT